MTKKDQLLEEKSEALAEASFSDEKVDERKKSDSLEKQEQIAEETLHSDIENLEKEKNIEKEKPVEKKLSPEEEQKRKLDEAEQNVAKQSSKKKKLINLGFFFLNIAIVAGILVYQLGGEDFQPINHINVVALFLIIFMFALNMFFETFTTSYLMKVTVGKWRPGLSYKVAAIGRYYDNVTPLATGGQPFQIIYLKNRGESIHTALSVPLAKYLFSQIAWVTVSFICLIVSFVDKSFNSFVSIVSIIGFILGSVVLVGAIFLSTCKTVGRKLVVKTLRLLYKMKIIKNYDKQYSKITKYIEDFQSVMQQYAKSPKDFFVMFFAFSMRMFIYYTIPYLIYCLLIGFDSSLYMQFIVMGVLVDLAASFFPLPGGTGMNEISFSAMFAPFFGSVGTFWAMLIWRFFSYYIFLLQGIIILSYDMAYGNRKYRWQVKKSYLVEESRVFKQQQIDKFRADRLKRRRKAQRVR